jgi:hypothetical protein
MINRFKYTCAAMLVISTVQSAGMATADAVINNGLAPPNPGNVIETDIYLMGDVHVQNVGCDVKVLDPCASPGAPTHVETRAGATVRALTVHETSHLELTGGSLILTRGQGASTIEMNGAASFDVELIDDASLVLNVGSFLTLNAYDQSTAQILGGTPTGGGILSGEIIAWNSATISMSGGQMDTLDRFLAYGNGQIVLYGNGFEVNGMPVPYGPIGVETGTLTGVLASGATLDNLFYHAGHAGPVCQAGPCTGTITLASAPPLPVASLLGQLAVVASLTLGARWAVRSAGPKGR